jgi:hypothetical protein
LFPTVLPVFSLALQARADITAEVLTETLDLEKVPTIGVSANADATGLQVLPPQDVIEKRPNTTGQVPVRSLDRSPAPGIYERTEGVHKFTYHGVASINRFRPESVLEGVARALVSSIPTTQFKIAKIVLSEVPLRSESVTLTIVS